MHYMHFIRSCSYAALANLLVDHHIHTEDFQIALSISLPYMFRYNPLTNSYTAGAELQGKKWFDYYLNPLSLTFTEHTFTLTEALSYLHQSTSSSMLGLNLEHGKHAVVYQGIVNGHYTFLNNKYKDEASPDYYHFSQAELINKLDATTHIGWLEALLQPTSTSTTQEFLTSLEDLKHYKKTLHTFCHTPQSSNTLKQAMEQLFAAPFLHLPAMMNLIDNKKLEEELLLLRAQYLTALRKNENLILANHLDYKHFESVLDCYRDLIHNCLE